MLDATSSANFSFLPHVNEDEQICRVQRDFLSKIHGIQFAPENVADRFSYERTLPNAPTFGFHGLFNMWRHLEDGEMMNLVDGLTVRTHQSREFAELMVQYFLLRKFKPLEHMYRKIKATQSKSDFSNHIARLTNNVQFSIDFADLCEKLTSEADRFGRSL